MRMGELRIFEVCTYFILKPENVTKVENCLQNILKSYDGGALHVPSRSNLPHDNLGLDVFEGRVNTYGDDPPFPCDNSSHPLKYRKKKLNT
jgi:hypothetical protein